MTLPSAAIFAEGRFARRFAGAILLLLLAVGTPTGPVRADDQDAYSATVKVDATAENALKARDTARLDGQRRALSAVVDRLSGGADKGKLARLDDNAITNLVDSFEVSGERMSAVRYFADYTFHFRPADIRRVMRDAGVPTADASGKVVGGGNPKAPAESPAKATIVLPLYVAAGKPVLWGVPNLWRQAWSVRPAVAGRVVVPSGDAGDTGAITADQAQAGDAGALAAIGQKNAADDVVVAIATPRPTSATGPAGIDVAIKRYRQGHLVDAQSKTIDANPGETDATLIRRAADMTAADIEAGSRKGAPQNDQVGNLTAIVPITSLQDWIQTRERLAAMPAIRRIDLRSLALQQAMIDIQYTGTVDQLTAALAAANFDFGKTDPAKSDTTWRLGRSGQPTPP